MVKILLVILLLIWVILGYVFNIKLVFVLVKLRIIMKKEVMKLKIVCMKGICKISIVKINCRIVLIIINC